MDRINGAGHVGHLFVAEDASISRPPTEITAEWLNGVQEELVKVIEAAGIAPSGSDFDQLVRAITKVKGCQRFTANGNFSVPQWVTTIYVSACAGGGGGGGAPPGSSGVGSGGGGGGAGQSIIRQPYAVTPGDVIAVTIGGGGLAGGISGNGGAGGNTVIGALVTLFGGLGGLAGVNVLQPAAGGGYGAGYPNGGYGSDSANASGADGGVGAHSPFGTAGGMSRGSTGGGVAGMPGYGYGAGGSGAGGYFISGSGIGAAGAAGMPGIVIIEW